MTDKIALVFGGSKGIGAACVDALAADGYKVAATYSQTAPTAPGTGQIRSYKVDIRVPEEVARVFDDLTRDFGGPATCVVANAGIIVPPAPLAEFDPEAFRRLIDTNVFGGFNMLSEAARRVADGGSIIALTTSMIRYAVPGGGPYTASKAAVESLARSLSKELAGRGVRVNCVAPGPVETDLFRSGKDEAALKRSAALSPFNRVGEPQEVAEVVRFLASDKASWVHGQAIQPNGGQV